MSNWLRVEKFLAIFQRTK